MSNRSIQHRAEGAREAYSTMLAAHVLMGLIGFVTSTTAARLLGPAGRGELAAIQQVPNLLGILGGLGMGEAALYFTAKQPSASRRIVTESLKIACAGSAVVMVAGWFLLEVLIADPTTRLSAQLCLPVAFAFSVLAVCQQPLRSLGHSRRWSYYRMTIAASWLAILTISALTGYRNVRGITLSFVLAQLAIAGWSLQLIPRYQNDEPPRWDAFKKRLLKYGLPSSLVTLPLFLNSRVDQVIMIAIVPRSELGIYATGVSFSLVALVPFQALAKITAPRIAAAGHEWRVIGIRLVLASVALVVVTLVVMVPLTSWAFTALMGNQFRSGVAAAQLLVAAAALMGCADVFRETIRGLGLPGRAVLVEIAGLVVGVSTLFMLIDKHGVVGAAVASNLGYGTALVGQTILLVVAFRRHGDRVRDTGGNSAGPANQ